MVQAKCRSQLPNERKAENCTLEKWGLLQTQWRTGKGKSAGSKLQSLAENWNMNIRCFQMPFKWITTLEPHVYCTYSKVLFEDKPFKLKSIPYSLPQVASKQFLVTTFIQFVWSKFFLFWLTQKCMLATSLFNCPSVAHASCFVTLKYCKYEPFFPHCSDIS